MGDRLFVGPLRGREPGLADACSRLPGQPDGAGPRVDCCPWPRSPRFLRGDDPDAAWRDTAGRPRVAGLRRGVRHRRGARRRRGGGGRRSGAGPRAVHRRRRRAPRPASRTRPARGSPRSTATPASPSRPSTCSTASAAVDDGPRHGRALAGLAPRRRSPCSAPAARSARCSARPTTAPGRSSREAIQARPQRHRRPRAPALATSDPGARPSRARRGRRPREREAQIRLEAMGPDQPARGVRPSGTHDLERHESGLIASGNGVGGACGARGEAVDRTGFPPRQHLGGAVPSRAATDEPSRNGSPLISRSARARQEEVAEVLEAGLEHLVGERVAAEDAAPERARRRSSRGWRWCR